jgi:hypothetical protein
MTFKTWKNQTCLTLAMVSVICDYTPSLIVKIYQITKLKVIKCKAS